MIRSMKDQPQGNPSEPAAGFTDGHSLIAAGRHTLTIEARALAALAPLPARIHAAFARAWRVASNCWRRRA
jgi:hypothetical protein